MMVHPSTIWFTEYFKSTTCQKRRSFKTFLLLVKAPAHLRALIEMDNENVVFMPSSTPSAWKPMDQGIILTFKSNDLINAFHDTITITYSDSSYVSGENKFKTFWKGFTILDAIKNIHDS